MKADERQLWDAMRQRGALNEGPGPSFRELAQSLGIPCKRAYYLAIKWAGRGWYEYGVSADLGWMTPEGMAVQR